MNASDQSSALIETLLSESGVSMSDPDHGIRCARFASHVFNVIGEALSLQPHHLRLATAAALFHDVGYERSTRDHHRKTFDILRETQLSGFDSTEQLIVACAARYHGGPYPHIEHAGFGDMTADDQRVVRRLAAIVRVAAALDASHMGIVQRVEAGVDTNGIWLIAYATGYAPVESDRLREAEGSFRVLTLLPLRTVVKVQPE